MLDREIMLPVVEKLRSLFKKDVAEISQSGNIISINIIDKEKWNIDLKNLDPYVGSMIFEEYALPIFEHLSKQFSQEEIQVQQLEISLKDVDRLYFYVEDNKVIGLSAIEYVDEQTGEKDTSTAILRDIIIQKNKRGKENRKENYARELYGAVFKNPDLKSLLGYSKTPQAIVQRTLTGKEYGFETSFANMDAKGNAFADQTSLHKRLESYMRHEGILAPSQEVEGGFGDKLPPGIVMLDGKLGILLSEPIRLPDSVDHPLYKQFQAVRKLQLLELDRNFEANRTKIPEDQVPPNVVAGLLISERKN